MTTLTTVYQGGLRTESTHTRSGNVLITDAPVDNNGKGEAFSPTDLVCTALSTCMLTTMGIWAAREGVDISGMRTEVIKVMGSNPRKIAEIQVKLSQKNLVATNEQKERLKDIALHCPVALSLHESVNQLIEFEF
ncbi:MAG TPA: OsmC family protein [Cyclobacteriaceae bacterium]|nr:OsmC family protein [Cyclobacteriaceae bacterium]HRJ82598.1 OsmC family protein [Cyclobacteriaceae bacterium]